MTTIGIEKCPTCGHTINKREIRLYRGLVNALWRVFTWCESKKTHEFTMKDVRELLDRNEYARFGDWVMFGGLVYKSKKAHYGLNMERCERFFGNLQLVPTVIYKDSKSGELTLGDYRSIRQIPNLSNFLNENMEYVARYVGVSTAELKQIPLI